MTTLARSASYVWRKRKLRKRYWGQEGVIKAVSVIHDKPERVVGIIKLNNGKKVAGAIVGRKGVLVKPGMRVRGVVRRMWRESKDELVVYGIKFMVIDVD